jgi:hypothetical protein
VRAFRNCIKKVRPDKEGNFILVREDKQALVALKFEETEVRKRKKSLVSALNLATM